MRCFDHFNYVLRSAAAAPEADEMIVVWGLRYEPMKGCQGSFGSLAIFCEKWIGFFSNGQGLVQYL